MGNLGLPLFITFLLSTLQTQQLVKQAADGIVSVDSFDGFR
jgi:hypothetical protein